MAMKEADGTRPYFSRRTFLNSAEKAAINAPPPRVCYREFIRLITITLQVVAFIINIDAGQDPGVRSIPGVTKAVIEALRRPRARQLT
jgi:hypothetical protein